MAGPLKDPRLRMDVEIRIPLTAEQKEAIRQAASALWTRDGRMDSPCRPGSGKEQTIVTRRPWLGVKALLGREPLHTVSTPHVDNGYRRSNVSIANYPPPQWHIVPIGRDNQPRDLTYPAVT